MINALSCNAGIMLPLICSSKWVFCQKSIAVVLLCVLLCAAGGADTAAHQASPAAGGAQQPAGTHSSSANGRWYGRAQRKGQLWVYVFVHARICAFPAKQSKHILCAFVCICRRTAIHLLVSGLDVVSARFGKTSCFGLNHRLYLKDVTSIIWIWHLDGSVLSCNHGYVDFFVAKSDHILTKDNSSKFSAKIGELHVDTNASWC